MRIVFNGGLSYYDDVGNLVEEGDTILYYGEEKKVYKGDSGQLGINATNLEYAKRHHIPNGVYEIYPFTEEDEVLKIS